MQNDPDYMMALHLQKQFNFESSIASPPQSLTYSKKKNKNSDNGKCLIDPSWELVDPTPNIHILFVQFNERFFWSKLGSVAVSWSKRMTTCAGICSYQGRGGLCHITLSEPLLKLRPRKDLVETLLHEMIHALLFVTHNNKDRDGHGPEFHKHMWRINGEAGTNITVYHDFHDEVRLYKQHWWRCDGPCQKRPPYFGMVRRAMNRAPGPYDRWFADHQRTCGGTFIKVKEPEKNTKTKNVKSKLPTDNKSPDIRNYFNNNGKENIHTINTQSTGGLGTKNKNGTVVLNPKNSAKSNDLSVTSVIPNSSNIVGFSKDSKTPPRNKIEVFSGVGKKLTDSSQSSSSSPDYNKVRNHWANKFTNNTSIGIKTSPKRKSSSSDSENFKKPKTETQITKNSDSGNFKKPKIETQIIKNSDPETNKSKNGSQIIRESKVECPNCNKFFTESELNIHLDDCLSADESITSEFSNESLKMIECPVCNVMIEEDDLNNHLDDCLKESNNKIKTETPKNKPDDCLKESNNKIKTETPNNKPESDKTKCDLCNKYFSSAEYTLHVQDCLNKFYDTIEEKLDTSPPTSSTVLCLVCNKNIVKDLLNEHLEECMVSVFDNDVFEKDVEETEDNSNDDQLNKTIYNCPICMEVIDESIMNSHIDECLNKDILKNEFS